jgi:hypothetical protein
VGYDVSTGVANRMHEAQDHLTIYVQSTEESDAGIDNAAAKLRERLAELPIERAEHFSDGASPPGAKSGDLSVLGVFTIVTLPKLLPVICKTIEQWLSQTNTHTVKIKKGDLVFEFRGKATAEDALRYLTIAANPTKSEDAVTGQK